LVLSNLLGRNRSLFFDDIINYHQEINRVVSSSSFLVLGGAGSIGREVVKELFKRQPLSLHVVDISENNLAELVRDLRSSVGYTSGEFATFALDIASPIYDAFIKSKSYNYDFVLNLSALKHVRSEKDPYTLMRMVEVNILNTIKTIEQSKKIGTRKYFCVSTDKAANPVNMMGASKRIMEFFLMHESVNFKISTARFANVAFSDGSLLQSFVQRFEKKQPIVAPTDIKRFFITPEESGQLCLLSSILGGDKEIFFPKLSSSENLMTFSDLAVEFLLSKGYEPLICESEQEARESVAQLSKSKKWPCYFSTSDTTGEKEIEEFYVENEEVELGKFKKIGIVKSIFDVDEEKLSHFSAGIKDLLAKGTWSKSEILELFKTVLPDFNHLETGKYLDSKM
jgi:FlaA1/EpsC-like NDP-sugar epimerase